MIKVTNRGKTIFGKNEEKLSGIVEKQTSWICSAMTVQCTEDKENGEKCAQFLSCGIISFVILR